YNPLAVSITFFFHCPAPSSFFHSFPTRRSSDLILVFWAISPNHVFLSPVNLVNLFQQAAVFMVLAMAEGFALILGEIDLSAMARDRKSTRLNSSHVSISYAVFCLKKK